MHKNIIFFINLLILSGTQASYAITAETKDIIGKATIEYLKTHPDEFHEVITAFQTHMQEKNEQKLHEMIKSMSDKLFAYSAGIPILGNPHGKDEIIVFMDPFCGFCRQFKETLNAAMADNPELKIIVRDIAIVHEKSILVAKALLAASLQGKYAPLQKALYDVSPEITHDDIVNKANDLGLNLEQFKKDMEGTQVDTLFQDNMALARDIKLAGTPTFIIKKTHKLLAGAIDLESLKTELKK